MSSRGNNNNAPAPRRRRQQRARSADPARTLDRLLNPNLNGQALREMAQAARVTTSGLAPREVPKRSRRPKGGQATVGRAPRKQAVDAKHAKLMAWLDLVSDPFRAVNNAKCPLNFNPAPSLQSFRICQVSSGASIKVTAGYVRQMTFWPGHGVMATPTVVVGATGAAGASDLDEVAFHSVFFNNAGGYLTPGPVNSFDGAGVQRNATAGHLSPDAAHTTGNTANSTFTGGTLNWNNDVGLTANLNIGHMRWKMIAAGLRVRNVTPVESRGGSIVTVQPPNVISMANFATQATFTRMPTFRIWGDGTDEVSVCWIPRTRDLAYWHQSNATSATGVPTVVGSDYIVGPGILAWLNASTTSDQYYSYEFFAHFELAGDGVQSFSTQTHSLSTPTAPVQQALGVHLTHSPTAAGIQHTVAAAVGTKVDAATKAATDGLGHIAKAGFQAAVEAVKAAF